MPSFSKKSATDTISMTEPDLSSPNRVSWSHDIQTHILWPRCSVCQRLRDVLLWNWQLCDSLTFEPFMHTFCKSAILQNVLKGIAQNLAEIIKLLHSMFLFVLSVQIWWFVPVLFLAEHCIPSNLGVFTHYSKMFILADSLAVISWNSK